MASVTLPLAPFFLLTTFLALVSVTLEILTFIVAVEAASTPTWLKPYSGLFTKASAEENMVASTLAVILREVASKAEMFTVAFFSKMF